MPNFKSLAFATCVVLISLCSVTSHPTTANRHRTVSRATSKYGAVAGEYIVVLAPKATMSTHISRIKSFSVSANTSAESVYSAASVGRKFQFNGWQAYSMSGSSAVAESLAADEDVAWVQPNNIFSVADTKMTNSDGLRRISYKLIPNNTQPYAYPNSAGQGVDVYVVDTGLKIITAEFGNRATFPISFVNNGELVDGYGHGTHVAGIVGSKSYGVAPKVSIIGVRVLDAAGFGSTSSIISGIQYAVTKAAESRRPSIINISISGGVDTALDAAVVAAVGAGVTVVVAAGNSAIDACEASPARVAQAITVAATDPTSDASAWFTNYGSCINITAPGVNILSTWNGNSTGVTGSTGDSNIMSGTSMASPFVAGVAALILSANTGATVAQVAATILRGATVGAISSLVSGTVNKLIFNGAVAGLSVS